MKYFLCALLLLAYLPAQAMTYFLSPTGNDASAGVLASSPWRTPYHQNLHCGQDRIVALPSTGYTASQFSAWGTVTCPTKDNVVWVQCAVFDACKMTMPAGLNQFGISIDQSFWGVQGFEI